MKPGSPFTQALLKGLSEVEGSVLGSSWERETLASTDFPPLFWIPGIMAETFPFLLLFVEANS